MNKLIQLLNEHRKEMNGDGKRYIDTDNYNMLTLNNLDKLSSELWVISKEYGFIQRLVDNDNIDIEKIENTEYYLIDWFYYWERKGFWIERKDDVVKILLMLLSIQDSPIEFLISILK